MQSYCSVILINYKQEIYLFWLHKERLFFFIINIIILGTAWCFDLCILPTLFPMLQTFKISSFSNFEIYKLLLTVVMVLCNGSLTIIPLNWNFMPMTNIPLASSLNPPFQPLFATKQVTHYKRLEVYYRNLVILKE